MPAIVAKRFPPPYNAEASWREYRAVMVANRAYWMRFMRELHQQRERARWCEASNERARADYKADELERSLKGVSTGAEK